MIPFNSSQADSNTAGGACFQECGRAPRSRQANDFGWCASTKQTSPLGDVNLIAKGLVSLFRACVIGSPITRLVRSLNAFVDSTNIGCSSFISVPTCGLKFIQIMSRRSGTQSLLEVTIKTLLRQRVQSP